MATVPIREFDDRLYGGDCDQSVRNIVTALRDAVDGANAVWRAHVSKGGWGSRAMIGQRVVCRINPKPTRGHVCVSIPYVQAQELVEVGTVHVRKGGAPWVDVVSVESAQAISPLIARACVEALAHAKRGA